MTKKEKRRREMEKDAIRSLRANLHFLFPDEFKTNPQDLQYLKIETPGGPMYLSDGVTRKNE